MNKPTPSPWVIDWDTFPDGGYVWVETQTGGGVALVDEAIRADLNLIAAAPDLLESLAECLEIMEIGGIWTIESQHKARAAIKKATGEE